MHVNKVNTYACKAAIPSSSPTKASNKPNGIMWKSVSIPPMESIVHAKLAIIFRRVCPEVIFAKSRIDNVKTLIMYDMNSIVISKGTINKGTPRGRNKAKNLIPCFWKPTIFIPINMERANVKVNIMWLVTVKL
jgi:hypothetical protein